MKWKNCSFDKLQLGTIILSEMFIPLAFLLVSVVTAADNKRLLLHNDVDVAAAFAGLQQNMTDFGNLVQQLQSTIGQLQAENHQLKSRVDQLQTDAQQTGNSGSVYVRWGRNVCPGNGSELVYKGVIGGTLYTSKGGGSNSLCLSDDPTWNKYIDGHQYPKSAIYGTEIEVDSGFSTTAFGYNYNDQDPPCATCHTSRGNLVMVPGRSNCYPGWTMEYTGYLVGGYPDHPANSDFICLDASPEELPHGLDSNSNNQHILYFVEPNCGSLPCPPYHEGREITCVVCSK